MNTQPLKDFIAFVEKEVSPAAEELKKLTSEKERKHLQRLVFTNLVDRFDTVIDATFIANASKEPLVSAALDTLKEPMTEGQTLRLLQQQATIDALIEERSREYVRREILREQHTKKLRKLFGILAPHEKFDNVPRVISATGKIIQKVTPPTTSSTPNSIAGYSHWLYVRRNSIVHGVGRTTLTDNDFEQLKKLYNITPAKGVKVSLGSVGTASVFYQGVVAILAGEAK